MVPAILLLLETIEVGRLTGRYDRMTIGQEVGLIVITGTLGEIMYRVSRFSRHQLLMFQGIHSRYIPLL